ncbi:ATP phosphoribosyltransferase regulatory subunit [Bienertia sinuspersici]
MQWKGRVGHPCYSGLRLSKGGGEEEDIGAVLVLCWAIWGARNKLVMEHEVFNPESIVAYAAKMQPEFNEAYSREDGGDDGGGSTREQARGSWTSPREGDEDGKILACAINNLKTLWEPSMAEAQAILRGVKEARALGLRKIEVESDSLKVVQALRNPSSGTTDELHLILEKFYFASIFENVNFSFVKREGNKVAHDLAHLQPLDLGQNRWESEFPTSILHVAALDLGMK